MERAAPKTVEVARAGRADLAVAEALGIARARALALIEAGEVRVAGRRIRKGHRLEAGTTFEVSSEAPEPAVIPEPDSPLSVLLEAPTYLVLDKPAGIPSHPLKPGERSTLANALVARFPECAAAGRDAREAGLCHRLDRETSGTILAARTPDAYAALRGQFQGRTVEKIYLALVAGSPEPAAGLIEIGLGGRGAVTRVWRGPRDGRNQPARTAYRTLWSGGDCALLEVRIETGVRHQIRAHLTAIGHPLLGDRTYGGRVWPLLPRYLLHAWRLGFRDPADGAAREARAPLPADARGALEHLGAPRLA